MYHFFVYLIISENRLVIVREKIDNPDYFYLMDNHGDDDEWSYHPISKKQMDENFYKVMRKI